MKKQKKLLLILMVCAVFCLAGCSALLPNPLEKEEAKNTKGQEALLSATANSGNAGNLEGDSLNATLYFRFEKEAMLAKESRMLSVPPNISPEKALVQALLKGPSAGLTELSRLFPEQTEVLSTVPQGSTLIIIFSEGLLMDFTDEPNDWQEREAWQEEVPLRRELGMMSLVNSITENFKYTQVQVLVQKEGTQTDSLRLNNTYYKNSALDEGIAPPLERNENIILTHYNTAKRILEAWQQRDWERLYSFIAVKDIYNGGALRPILNQAVQEWHGAGGISAYHISPGSISNGGARCVFDCEINITIHEGNMIELKSYPLRLISENDIWKMAYSDLSELIKISKGGEASS